MRLVNLTLHYLNRRQYLLYLLLFFIAVLLFSYLQFNSTFADPDSFYHAKMAQILLDQGTITQFPWLSATTLKYSYTDHHFLYHILLIPFVSLFPPLIGLKVATVLFASLVIVVFFWFLKQLKVRGAFWYALFLLTVNPFVFRLNLAKAQAVVLILLLIALYLLFNRHYLSLIFVSWLYVWLYAGWPLLLVLTTLYLLVSWFKNRKPTGWLVIKRAKSKVWRQNLALFFSVAVGLVAGLFFSPYFPKNFYFYWQQVFKIALVNYQKVIGVGGEWYPYPLPELLVAALPFFILTFIALLLFIPNYDRHSVYTWLFFIMTILFFALALKSRRNVEYFIPITLIFSALSISTFFDCLGPRRAVWPLNKLIFYSPLIFILLFWPVFVRDLYSIKVSYQQGVSLNKFVAPSAWLKDHTIPGTIVFHSDWDDFPILFYHNSWNYYIVGLDPTFMYEYDKDLHKSWVDITTGQTNQDLYYKIKKVFGADYVLVDFNSNVAFDRNLANNFYFEKVFENLEARVYHVSD